jgi:hypothetical protein
MSWLTQPAIGSTGWGAQVNANFEAIEGSIRGRKWFRVNSAAATWQAIGVAAPTSSGTLSNANASDSTYVRAQSGATAGNTGGVISATFNLLRRQHNPYFRALIQTYTSIASARIWIGLCSAAPGNSDNPTGQFAAFRYSSGVGGNWYACCKDGTTMNAQDAGVAVAASTKYLLEITVDDSAGTVEFKIDGTVVATLNANLPSASQDLGYVSYIVTTAAGAKSLLISRLQCELGV